MEFSKELIEVFDYIGEKMGIAIDWSSENVIPYIIELCGKYINWEIATSTIWIVAGVVVATIATCWYKWVAKHTDEETYDEREFRAFSCTVMACAWLGVLILTCVQAFDIVKCVAFPELQIYEFITGMTSSN